MKQKSYIVTFEVHDLHVGLLDVALERMIRDRFEDTAVRVVSVEPAESVDADVEYYAQKDQKRFEEGET